MSFPRYPKYKDSGVETVGRLCWAETTFAILHAPPSPNYPVVWRAIETHPGRPRFPNRRIVRRSTSFGLNQPHAPNTSGLRREASVDS